MKIDIKEKIQSYKRVLQITKKPDREEFRVIMKITSLGVIIIGLLGFLVSILYQLIRYGLE